ncbi:MAG: sugar isomerase [Rickettsiales bacterium]|nr:sugar isomerase [Rickettsiales bacterium]|tara:strand:+ start:2598 stop:3218 length:621 start_codon:yes stop_codon:yes gene_type:complete
MKKVYKKNNLDKFFKNKKEIYFESYTKYLSLLLKRLPNKKINKFITKVIKTTKTGNMIYVAGNGGSASTANHFAIDFMMATNGLRKKIRCISLNSNEAVVTAIANDFDYKYVFSKQLEFLGKKGDILIVISASGNSENLLNAIKYAKKNRISTVSFTSFDGGKIGKISDLDINIKTEIDEYGPAEDAHLILNHIITTYVNKMINLK